MTVHRRNFVAGGCFFFTVNLAERRSRRLTDNIALLRAAFRATRARHPFAIDAIVVLPDHLHTIWTLPQGDSDFAVVSRRVARALDIIALPLLAPCSNSYQSENWLLNPTNIGRRSGRCHGEQLRALTDGSGESWINGYRTRHGRHDRIPLDRVGSLASSLKFIVVDFVQLHVFSPDAVFGSNKRRVQARFAFAGDRLCAVGHRSGH